MILDFKEIPEAHIAGGKQDTFEMFARDFFEELGFNIIEGPDRGADGGRDLIIEEERNGLLGKTNIRWLVSCKHKAHSGRSVTDKDDSNIKDRMERNKAGGFIGFYSTLPSSSLQKTIQNSLEEKGKIFDREKIENMIKDEDLQEYIKLLGVKKNPYPWIKNSKLLVHSSRYEGFGLVLVEALILGKVVISSNCKVGPREILNNGEYGSLVEVGDYNAMAQEILELLQENPKKKEKYLSNIDKSIERFDKKNIIKQIERVLEGI